MSVPIIVLFIVCSSLVEHHPRWRDPGQGWMKIHCPHLSFHCCLFGHPQFLYPHCPVCSLNFYWKHHFLFGKHARFLFLHYHYLAVALSCILSSSVSPNQDFLNLLGHPDWAVVALVVENRPWKGSAHSGNFGVEAYAPSLERTGLQSCPCGRHCRCV